MIRRFNQWRYGDRCSPSIGEVWAYFICWCVGHTNGNRVTDWPFCERCGRGA